MNQRTDDSLAGTVIAGKYRVLERVGSGRFGTVYRVETSGAERERLALKLLPDGASRDPGFRERFTSDLRVAGGVDNKYIVPIRDSGITERGRLYYVMDWCEGTSLSSLLRKEGVLSIPRALRLARKVLRALEAAHSTGLVHCGVSPSNVFVVSGDGNRSIRVLDFGVPRQVGDGKGGGWSGVSAYMPPEQLAHQKLSFGTDLYAVGVILHESITGVKLYPASSAKELLELFETTEPAPAQKFEPEVAEYPGLPQILAKAIDRDPARRFQTAGEFIQAIQRVLRGKPPSASIAAVRVPGADDAGSAPTPSRNSGAPAAPAPRASRAAAFSGGPDFARPIGILLYCVVFSAWIHDAFAGSRPSGFYVDFALYSVVFVAVYAILVKLERRLGLLARLTGRFRRARSADDRARG